MIEGEIFLLLVLFVVIEYLNLRVIYGYIKVDVKMVDNEGLKFWEFYDVLRYYVKIDYVKIVLNVCCVYIILLFNIVFKSNIF